MDNQKKEVMVQKRVLFVEKFIVSGALSWILLDLITSKKVLNEILLLFSLGFLFLFLIISSMNFGKILMIIIEEYQLLLFDKMKVVWKFIKPFFGYVLVILVIFVLVFSLLKLGLTLRSIIIAMIVPLIFFLLTQAKEINMFFKKN